MSSAPSAKLGRDATRVSRRDFLKTASAAGALGISPVAKSVSHAANVAELPIDVAGYDYDRVRALIDGRVEIEGCNTRFEISTIGEMNTHAISGPRTREVTEIGLHPFMLAYANDGFGAYTLIPVFPLRVFRHKSIFIRTDRGIKKPEDLRGKTIATSGYSSTSLPWVTQEMEGTRALMGKNYWPYGIEPSRKALTALFRYSYGQGLSARELTIEELFHPSGLHLTESLG